MKTIAPQVTCGACDHAHATEHRGQCGAFMGVNQRGPVFCTCPRLEPIR